MDSVASADEFMPIFYVGQHESKRCQPVSARVLRQAQDCDVGNPPEFTKTPVLMSS